MEGLGTMLAGLWGSGNGTNTFGENVGTIGKSLDFPKKKKKVSKNTSHIFLCLQVIYSDLTMVF